MIRAIIKLVYDRRRLTATLLNPERYHSLRIVGSENPLRMKENMQKIWQWIRDRKTNTIRKWRSTLVPRSSESMESSEKLGKRVGHSVSDINLPSTSKEQQLEYEQFFDEPRTKNFLDIRRASFRERSESYTFPVIPPDLDDGWCEQ